MNRLLQGIALAGLGLLLLGSCSSPAKDPPNVLLIVIDTLRADRVSSYGYPRPTTPRIDAIAERGIRFENAYSTSSWTLPSHASLFTGLFPIEHGATQEHTRLDDRASTLAELLAADGYATLGVCGNPVINQKSGLTRGFETFIESWRGQAGHRSVKPGRHPNLLALRDYLAKLEPGRPFFAFVNYMEVHGPYQAPEPYRSRFLRSKHPVQAASLGKKNAHSYYLEPNAISEAEFAVLNDLYDAEVAHVDALVGALVDELESTGQLDNTLLIITSDHGENLGEHGHYRHVFSLYHTTVRIPLIAVLPDGSRAGEVRAEGVSLVDLFRTILTQTQVATGANLSEINRDRARDIFATPESAKAPLFAEYYYPLQAFGLFAKSARGQQHEKLTPYLRRLRSVESGGWRYIWSSDGRHELYDLERDPLENHNFAADRAAEPNAQRLRAQLAEFVARGGGPRPLPQQAAEIAPVGVFEDLDKESEEQLRALGYLGD